MRYTKNQIPVEAFQYAVDAYPEWFNEAVLNGSVNFAAGLIYTFEGEACRFNPGDYIVLETDGFLRPYTADIFKKIYKENEE